MADKIFKTALMLVSLIAGYAYAEKVRYDNEDDTEDEGNYDNETISDGEIKEEISIYKVYKTYFLKPRYGIKIGMESSFYPNFGKNIGMGLGIISEIPLSNEGPFILGLGVELNGGIIPNEIEGELPYKRVVIRASSLFHYTSQSKWVRTFGVGLFNDFRVSDDRVLDNNEKFTFDPGFIFVTGIRRHKDETTSFLESIFEHLGSDGGIIFKNPNFYLYVSLTYFF